MAKEPKESGEVKKPKVKWKYQNPYTLKDSYDLYKSRVDNELYDVTWEEYLNITSDYLKALVEHLLVDAARIKLPRGLGKLQVVKAKLNLNDSVRLHNIDWAETKRLGHYVRYLNEHTSGYRYSFIWDRSGCSINNLIKYRLQMTRLNKRRLAKMIKSKQYDYFEKTD